MSALLVAALLCLGAFVHRPMMHRFGHGTLFHLVRFPGNLLHELAHALVTLACGYTIAGFTVSIFDPDGRGSVHPGRPFLPYARPWLANLLAPVAPVGFGVGALTLLYRWSGAPALPLGLADVPSALAALPWEDGRLWAGLALALPICAEMAPSDVDMRAWRLPAFGLLLVAAAGAWAAEHVAPGTPLAVFRRADAWLWAPMAQAIAVAVWSTMAWAPFSWLVGRLMDD
jgi:hypothetical protein